MYLRETKEKGEEGIRNQNMFPSDVGVMIRDVT